MAATAATVSAAGASRRSALPLLLVAGTGRAVEAVAIRRETIATPFAARVASR